MTVASEGLTLDLDETIQGDPRPIHDDDALPELAHRLVGTQLSLYRIEKFLGRGGMALVFQARHNMLHRHCAVKILRPELEKRSPHSVELFLREARAAASLVHPHVVAVHNIGDSDGLHYLEMEYVPGESLQRLLASRPGFLPIEATNYLLQTCSALAAAHEHGLIHRDFKPSNILVRADGVAKLADFGLAKRVAQAPPGAKLDRPSLTGTPYYMAPELFRGLPGSRASDVYAVGVSYFYLLTGCFPFKHRHIARLADLHEKEPVPDPRQYNPLIPEPVVDFICRAMAKDPDERFRDGAESHERLQRLFIQLRSLRSIVEEAIQGIPARLLESDGQTLEILVTSDNGRTQRIFVRESCSDAWSTQVVRVFSICAPAVPYYYEKALELNAQVPHGSLAIEPVDGQPHFVMLNNCLRSTCDPLEIRHSILDIARWADDIEQALTGEDRY
jgi:serine/threonine-protein kinase